MDHMLEDRETYVSLKSHFDAILAEREKTERARFDGQQLALRIATDELNHWRATHNDAKQQIKEFAAGCITRPEHDSVISRIDEIKHIQEGRIARPEFASAIDNLKSSVSGLKATVNRIVGGLIVLQIGIAIILHFWKN